MDAFSFMVASRKYYDENYETWNLALFYQDAAYINWILHSDDVRLNGNKLMSIVY